MSRRLRNRQARRERKRLADQYDTVSTSLKEALRKADERDQRLVSGILARKLPAKIKPCPDPESTPGFQSLSRAAIKYVAGVFRIAGTVRTKEANETASRGLVNAYKFADDSRRDAERE